MILYLLIVLTIVSFSYTHVTAEEYTTYIKDYGEYTADIVLLAGMFGGALCLHFIGRGIVPTPFVFGVWVLVCAICSVGSVVWYMVGQYPTVISAICTITTAICAIYHLAPPGQRLRTIFE